MSRGLAGMGIGAVVLADNPFYGRHLFVHYGSDFWKPVAPGGAPWDLDTSVTGDMLKRVEVVSLGVFSRAEASEDLRDGAVVKDASGDTWQRHGPVRSVNLNTKSYGIWRDIQSPITVLFRGAKIESE